MWQPQGLFSQYLLRTPIILMGKNSIKELYDYAGKKFAIIHGSSLSSHTKVPIQETFKKADIKWIKRSWQEEPTIDALSDTIAQLEEYQPDVIVACGGGSVIDGTKLCRLFYEFPCFELFNAKLDGVDLKTKFIAIPTTIGSGAEISSAAVYLDHKTHSKQMIVMHELQPDVIVYDHTYLNKTPLPILCASTLDAISHILEGYVSNRKNALAEILAEKGLSLIHQAFTDHDIDYEKLQYAGFIGGLVQNHCIVGAAHAIAHQMTEFGYSHGVAIGLILNEVIQVNSSDLTICNQYQKIAKAAGFLDLNALLDFIQNLLDQGNLSTQKAKFKETLSKNLDHLMPQIINDRGGQGNPLSIDREYVLKVLRS